ncbi:hypothetical protein AB0M95_22945 [Sphaerisporangium sp. NPDC051017]|uniref:hypothetical protein n=1 Tax=Sphaerisporangium sp. NPDC051017 TaxID=3154636 RepID=UPI00341DE486
MAQRARDSADYQGLDAGDPRRAVIGERLLPSTAGGGPLLVTPQRHWGLVHTLRAVLDQERAWLAANEAAGVHLLASDVPRYPDRDDTDSEMEGRSQDALPEAVFLQLMGEENLALLPDGTARDFTELSLRIGRRPWEVRHLEFDCVVWHDIDIEAADGSVQRRRYPFLVYWMQKVRRRHKLPLHPTDVEVITRRGRLPRPGVGPTASGAAAGCWTSSLACAGPARRSPTRRSPGEPKSTRSISSATAT